MAMIAPLPPRRPPWLLPVAAAAILLGLAAALAGFHHFRAEVLGEAADDQPFHTAKVQVVPDASGRPPLLTLSPDAPRGEIIQCRRLDTVRFQPGVPAVGSVVDIVDLAETRDALATAGSIAGKARADLELAHTEAVRREALPGNGGSDSPQTCGTTRSEQRLDEADVRAASDLARVRREVALALYGPTIAGWMQAGSAELDPILQHRASLLLLTPLPGHAAVSLPAEAAVTDRRGELTHARLISVTYRTDQRLRSISGLYRADDEPANPRFIPGPTLSARLLVGPALTGVVAPASAVLLHDGRSWVYVEEGPGQYRRHEISLAQALPDGSGWFQDDALQAGQTVITAGATLLLEEER